MVETLKIAGGEHVLISPVMLGSNLSTTNVKNEEKEKFMAICFIFRRDPDR